MTSLCIINECSRKSGSHLKVCEHHHYAALGRLCCIEDCNGIAVRRGYCNKHYVRLVRAQLKTKEVKMSAIHADSDRSARVSAQMTAAWAKASPEKRREWGANIAAGRAKAKAKRERMLYARERRGKPKTVWTKFLSLIGYPV